MFLFKLLWFRRRFVLVSVFVDVDLIFSVKNVVQLFGVVRFIVDRKTAVESFAAFFVVFNQILEKNTIEKQLEIRQKERKKERKMSKFYLFSFFTANINFDRIDFVFRPTRFLTFNPFTL
jgi:hypothetical protein